MANNNDFKLIKRKNRKMFDHIEAKVNSKLDQLNEEDKERLGFYHLVLENITGVIDSLEDNYTIIDTQYNKLVNNVALDDLGIDAVNYSQNDDGEIDIQLFNFKYRKTFNSDKTKSENDISRSTKFLEYIVADEILTEGENNLVHKQINKIIRLNASNKVCNLRLYMVSNEGQSFAPSSNKYIEILEKSYDMKIINISLDDIISFYNPKNEQRKSSFMISPDEFLSFESDERSTQKSYILKLSLLDLIRITSENEKMANLYSIEDDEQLIDARLDFSLLYDNVWGYLGETKYNKNIIETLSESIS